MSISVSSRKRHSFQEGGSATFRGSSGGAVGQSRGVSPLNSQEMKDGGGSSGSNDSGSFAGSPQRYSISHFVSRVFYRLGLLCASQPRFVLILTFLVIVWSCCFDCVVAVCGYCVGLPLLSLLSLEFCMVRIGVVAFLFEALS